MSKIKVVVTDDHEMIQAGLEKLLSGSEKIEFVAGFSSGRELLLSLNSFHPDIILMDIDMPVMNGFETSKAVLNILPEMKIIALTVCGEPASVKKSKDFGMKGYILKNVNSEELINAIETVYRGKTYYSPDITEILLAEELKPSDTHIHGILTDRETEITRLIAQGHSNTQIASKLYISPRTVDTHRTNIMKKIAVNNIAGIVRYAISNGLV